MGPTTNAFQLFINNEFVNSNSGKTFDSFSPSTGNHIAKVAEGDKSDVDKAVKVGNSFYFLCFTGDYMSYAVN